MAGSHEPAPPQRNTPRRGPGMRLWVGAVAFLALAATAARVGLTPKPAETGEAKKAARVVEFAPADLAEPRQEALGRRIPVSGSLKPVLSATVRAKVPGEVTRVHVQEGHRVTGGQLLASLDEADLRARLDRELATVAEARARLDLARKNEANNAALLEKAFISRNAYDGFVNTLTVAEAGLKSAEAQAAIARRALDDAQIRAPFAGIVARRWVNVGDKATADAPVAAIVDLSRMELEAQIPVGETPHVKAGQALAFRVDGFAQREFAGRVDRVNPTAEPGSRSVSIYAAIDNADGSLRGGMFASGTLVAADRSPVAVIPASALVEEGGQAAVMVLKDGKIERRPVVTGARSAEQGLVEIREGLEPAARVITVSTAGIKPGTAAVVRGAPKAP